MILAARFGHHWGHWDSVTGKCYAYTLEFVSVYQALNFLQKYPAGPDYCVIYDGNTGQVRLEDPATTFQFGPPLD